MSLVTDARQAHIARQQRLGALMPPRPIPISEDAVLVRNERDSLRIQLAKADEQSAEYRAMIDAQTKEIHDLREALKLKLSIPNAPIDSGPVKMADILKIVAEFYKVPQSQIMSHRRQLVIVKPRQVCMYLAREMTIRSFPEIGRFLGGRDHTTVMHAWNRVTTLMEFDGDFRTDVEVLKAQVERIKADAMAG